MDLRDGVVAVLFSVVNEEAGNPSMLIKVAIVESNKACLAKKWDL